MDYFNILGKVIQEVSTNTELNAEGLAALLAIFITFFTIFIVLLALFIIGAYIYMSLAFMSIAKKMGLCYPGIAWVPSLGPVIISFRISKMHWWPWLLFIPSYASFWLTLAFPIVGWIIYASSMIIIFVYSIMWDWKMFRAVKRPGWWALTCLLFPLYWVFVGIAAWGKEDQSQNY